MKVRSIELINSWKLVFVLAFIVVIGFMVGIHAARASCTDAECFQRDCHGTRLTTSTYSCTGHTISHAAYLYNTDSGWGNPILSGYMGRRYPYCSIGCSCSCGTFALQVCTCGTGCSPSTVFSQKTCSTGG